MVHEALVVAEHLEEVVDLLGWIGHVDRDTDRLHDEGSGGIRGSGLIAGRP
jgi:hypothetical protein